MIPCYLLIKEINETVFYLRNCGEMSGNNNKGITMISHNTNHRPKVRFQLFSSNKYSFGHSFGIALVLARCDISSYNIHRIYANRCVSNTKHYINDILIKFFSKFRVLFWFQPKIRLRFRLRLKNLFRLLT